VREKDEGRKGRKRFVGAERIQRGESEEKVESRRVKRGGEGSV